MNWLINNIPLISGVAVAFLSFLTSFIKLLNERSVSTKGIKKIKDYTDIYAVLPDSVEAKDNIAQLLNQETKRILARTGRKVNVTNVVAVVIVAIAGGALSYLLVLWATNSSVLVFTVLAWLLFAISVIFTLGISITGLASIYKEPKNE
jgi:amino acid transporter